MDSSGKDYLNAHGQEFALLDNADGKVIKYFPPQESLA
jgi:hypothetical protein